MISIEKSHDVGNRAGCAENRICIVASHAIGKKEIIDLLRKALEVKALSICEVAEALGVRLPADEQGLYSAIPLGAEYCAVQTYPTVDRALHQAKAMCTTLAKRVDIVKLTASVTPQYSETVTGTDVKRFD